MRHPDWLPRLHVYLDGARAWQFDPVRANCGIFTLGVIEAVTCKAPAAVLEQLGLEMPDSEIGVARVLADFDGMRGLAEAYFGEPARLDILNAQRGDIAILKGDDGDTLGVVEGAGVVCISSAHGIGRFPLTEAQGFWSLA